MSYPVVETVPLMVIPYPVTVMLPGMLALLARDNPDETMLQAEPSEKDILKRVTF